MTATPIETIPTIWDDSRDSAFFRITARLFSCDFCFGASVILASYDVDETMTQSRSWHHPDHYAASLRSCQ